MKLHCEYIHTFNDYSVFQNANINPPDVQKSLASGSLQNIVVRHPTYKLGLHSQPCQYIILKAISIIKCVATALIHWNHNTELMRHLFSDVGQIIVHNMLKQYTAYTQ